MQEGRFMKIALNLDLTLSDDGECRTFFDSPRNYWFRCFLRRVMVILLQQKNFGPNVIYFVLGTLLIETYSLTKTLRIVVKLTYSWPKHCLLLRDWHFLEQNIAYCCEIDISRLKTAALSDFSGPPGFYGSHRGSTRVFGRWIGLYRGGFGRYLVEVRYP